MHINFIQVEFTPVIYTQFLKDVFRQKNEICRLSDIIIVAITDENIKFMGKISIIFSQLLVLNTASISSWSSRNINIIQSPHYGQIGNLVRISINARRFHGLVIWPKFWKKYSYRLGPDNKIPSIFRINQNCFFIFIGRRRSHEAAILFK